MKRLMLLLALGWCLSAGAQELYVYSEPASNMPAHSLASKLSTLLDRTDRRTSQRYMAELMAGLSSQLMVHVGTSFSNMPAGRLRWESVYAYSKYRFLSHDDMHRHFRMAAFAEAAYSQRPVQTGELNFQGERSGVQLGVIATQLVGRMALSATVSHSQALDAERFDHNAYSPYPYQSLNYSLSGGLLVLPFSYTSYRQLNLNIYLELLGQRTLDRKTFYTDLAPSIQFLFNSNSKLNLGYRFEVGGNQLRNMDRGFLVSFEHSFFNAIGKK